METGQSQATTQHERKDSVMATPSIEDRLSRLEEAHSVHGPIHINSPLICKASLKHTQQISDLGEEFNNLDEALHALEQANNSREARVRKLEQQMCALQSMEADGKGPVFLNAAAKEGNVARSDPFASPCPVQPRAQQSTLDDITSRLHQLEKGSTQSLSDFTTYDIAQTLVQRLGSGETLEQMVDLQLRVSLSARDGPPLTTVATSTTRGGSTLSNATLDDQHIEAGPGRPPKRKSTLR